MQKIYAEPPPDGEHDFYIDTLPVGGAPAAGDGFPWYEHVGKVVDNVYANQDKNKKYWWLKKQNK